MIEECSFHVVLRREALGSISVGEGRCGECELAGEIGRVLDIGVREGLIVEIRGEMGMIRFSVPPQVLPLLGLTTEVEEEVEGE